MPRPWLTFLVIGTASAIVFVFFLLRLRPVQMPEPDVADSAVGTLDQPTVTYVNPSRGPADAEVTLVTFGDFQCDACKTLAENMVTAMRSYPDSVRLVWKDMPNEDAHPLATKAAVAAHCADRQGRFWEFHDLVFARQSYLSEEELTNVAAEVGLDADAFARCTQNNDTLAVVRRDFEEGRALGIIATPTLFVGTQSVAGALSVESIVEIIEGQLAK